jgi:hypothetical protein
MRDPAKWEHQDEQMPDAFGYIVDGLESAFAKGYSDDHGSPSQIVWASRCRTAYPRGRQATYCDTG